MEQEEAEGQGGGQAVCQRAEDAQQVEQHIRAEQVRVQPAIRPDSAAKDEQRRNCHSA